MGAGRGRGRGEGLAGAPGWPAAPSRLPGSGPRPPAPRGPNDAAVGSFI